MWVVEVGGVHAAKRLSSRTEGGREGAFATFLIFQNSTCLSKERVEGEEGRVCVCVYVRGSIKCASVAALSETMVAALWSLSAPGRRGERGVKRDLKRGISNTDKCITSSDVPLVSPVTT